LATASGAGNGEIVSSVDAAALAGVGFIAENGGGGGREAEEGVTIYFPLGLGAQEFISALTLSAPFCTFRNAA